MIDKSLPFSLPVIAGLLLTTRILYSVPVKVPGGIVPGIVPAVVDGNVPIVTGEAKLPLASDNCAVKTFPKVKVPVMEKGTETFDPEQNGEPAIAPVDIVFLAANTKYLFVPMASEPVTP